MIFNVRHVEYQTVTDIFLLCKSMGVLTLIVLLEFFLFLDKFLNASPSLTYKCYHLKMLSTERCKSSVFVTGFPSGPCFVLACQSGIFILDSLHTQTERNKKAQLGYSFCERRNKKKYKVWNNLFNKVYLHKYPLLNSIETEMPSAA